MKKLLSVVIGTAILGVAVAGMGACNLPGGEKDGLKVYAPDGAPALALANAISGEDAKEEELFDFEIVSADTIQTYVTGTNPKADICVLPVNAAAKILGAGTTYQMLGTVTNGNLYFLTTGENPSLTAENIEDTLIGKKVGVIQLANVPGLTLQVVLANYGIDYQTLQSADAENVAADKVNLIPFTPDNVTPAGGCDYYLCPEPAASAKIKGTQGVFKMAGSLQELYGEEGGYPQAAVVAKKTVIENRKEEIQTFIGYLEGSASFLESASVENILKLLGDHREDGLTLSFNANNLTPEVIARCSVRYTASKNCKDKVNAFLDKLLAVKADSTAKPEDGFFYMG